MKNNKKFRFTKKHAILLAIIIFLLLFINKLVLDRNSEKLILNDVVDITADSEILSSNITKDSVVIWDNNSLKFYDFKGENIADNVANGYYTEVYYNNDETILLDKQLNILYFYNSLGKLVSKVELSGEVFSIFVRDGNYYVVRKDRLENETNESLTRISKDGKEVPIYRTNSNIIDVRETNGNIYVTELIIENYSYKSTLNIIKGSENEKFDFGSETIIAINPLKKNTIIVTNKNIYSLAGYERTKVALKNFKDFYFDGDETVVLYSNKLDRFNKNLQLVESKDVNITNTGVLRVKNSDFVYGPTDLIGFLGEDRQFTSSFNGVVNNVETNGKEILSEYRFNAKVMDLKREE